MNTSLVPFLSGATAFAAVVAGMLFLRFWRKSGDRLFLGFALAFWTLSLDWTAAIVVAGLSEFRPYVYLTRLVAFVIIIISIIDKNRRGSGDIPGPPDV